MTTESEVVTTLKSVDSMSPAEYKDAVTYEMVETVAVSLMKRWFPKNMPEGEDLLRWCEIAYDDSKTAIDGLIEAGYVNLNDERYSNDN